MRGGRRTPRYAWAPCDEHGAVTADFTPAESCDAAAAALSSFPFGGMARRTGHGRTAYNWGFGWAATPEGAVAMMGVSETCPDCGAAVSRRGRRCKPCAGRVMAATPEGRASRAIGRALRWASC